MSHLTIEIVCAYCGNKATKRKGNVDASIRNGVSPTCSFSCASRLSSKKGGASYASINRLLSGGFKTIGGCIEWDGFVNKDGYGRISWREKYGKTPVLAHRAAYEMTNGAIPQGMCVCHSCDNPKCINPDHLWLGTVGDNNRDMIAKGRHNFQTNKPSQSA